MTPQEITPQPVERITLDDLKNRAEKIKDIAVTDVKTATTQVLETDATKTLLIVAGVVIAAASIAYFLGSRAGGRRVPIDPLI